MKITASTGAIADAFVLAASLSADDKCAKKIATLEAIRIKTADSAALVSGNILDHAVSITVPATIEIPGELAVSGSRLAALANGFARTETIMITAEGKTARVDCSRSRFKLATIPLDDLPPMLRLVDETGNVELAREQVLKFCKGTTFAISADKAQYYLAGLFLHDAEDGLAAVATDGHRLARVVVPDVSGLSSDAHLVIPAAAVKIVTKLLADRSSERVTLRRSRTLIAVETAKAAFISKLIDATFLDYNRVMPEASGNAVTIARAELAQALERVKAVLVDDRQPVVGFSWGEEDPLLHLSSTDNSDAADDVILCEDATGTGRVAMQIGMLMDLLNAHAGKRIRFDSRNGADPVLITDPDYRDFTALQMPCNRTRAAA